MMTYGMIEHLEKWEPAWTPLEGEWYDVGSAWEPRDEKSRE